MTELTEILRDPAHWVAEVVMDGTTNARATGRTSPPST